MRFGFDFSGDLVLKTTIKELSPADEVSIDGSNVLTCAGKTFGSLKVGDLITYNLTTDSILDYIELVQ